MLNAFFMPFLTIFTGFCALLRYFFGLSGPVSVSGVQITSKISLRQLLGSCIYEPLAALLLYLLYGPALLSAFPIAPRHIPVMTPVKGWKYLHGI